MTKATSVFELWMRRAEWNDDNSEGLDRRRHEWIKRPGRAIPLSERAAAAKAEAASSTVYGAVKWTRMRHNFTTE